MLVIFRRYGNVERIAPSEGLDMISYFVRYRGSSSDPEAFRGQRVVIIGGGDSAFDWGTQLLDRATRVSIVHRSDRFRAHGATVAQFQEAVDAGRADLFTFHELLDIKCTTDPERFSHIELPYP